MDFFCLLCLRTSQTLKRKQTDDADSDDSYAGNSGAKDAKKVRLCGKCRDSGHTRRNCPVLGKQPKKETRKAPRKTSELALTTASADKMRLDERQDADKDDNGEKASAKKSIGLHPIIRVLEKPANTGNRSTRALRQSIKFDERLLETPRQKLSITFAGQTSVATVVPGGQVSHKFGRDVVICSVETWVMRAFKMVSKEQIEIILETMQYFDDDSDSDSEEIVLEKQQQQKDSRQGTKTIATLEQLLADSHIRKDFPARGDEDSYGGGDDDDNDDDNDDGDDHDDDNDDDDDDDKVSFGNPCDFGGKRPAGRVEALRLLSDKKNGIITQKEMDEISEMWKLVGGNGPVFWHRKPSADSIFNDEYGEQNAQICPFFQIGGHVCEAGKCENLVASVRQSNAAAAASASAPPVDPLFANIQQYVPVKDIQLRQQWIKNKVSQKLDEFITLAGGMIDADLEGEFAEISKTMRGQIGMFCGFE